jgi:hypothetical protein
VLTAHESCLRIGQLLRPGTQPGQGVSGGREQRLQLVVALGDLCGRDHSGFGVGVQSARPGEQRGRRRPAVGDVGLADLHDALHVGDPAHRVRDAARVQHARVQCRRSARHVQRSDPAVVGPACPGSPLSGRVGIDVGANTLRDVVRELAQGLLVGPHRAVYPGLQGGHLGRGPLGSLLCLRGGLRARRGDRQAPEQQDAGEQHDQPPRRGHVPYVGRGRQGLDRPTGGAGAPRECNAVA